MVMTIAKATILMLMRKQCVDVRLECVGDTSLSRVLSDLPLERIFLLVDVLDLVRAVVDLGLERVGERLVLRNLHESTGRAVEFFSIDATTSCLSIYTRSQSGRWVLNTECRSTEN
jgi:hypothetical protein